MGTRATQRIIENIKNVVFYAATATLVVYVIFATQTIGQLNNQIVTLNAELSKISSALGTWGVE